MDQNISKNVTQSRFNYPPPPPPPPTRFNDLPPPPPKFNKPTLVRQNAYNEYPKQSSQNSFSNRSNYTETDYLLYITYGFIIMFVVGLIMSIVSYYRLDSLNKNPKDNKDKITKWNQIYFTSIILVMIPLLITIFMVCAKSPMSCVGLFLLRR